MSQVLLQPLLSSFSSYRILYERLSIVPPSPNPQDHLPLPSTTTVPPQQTGSRPVLTNHHHREIRDHSASLDPDQVHSLQEHTRPQGNLRVPSGPDPRSLPVLDNSIASAVAPSPHMSLHSPRRISSGHDSGTRHHLPTMGQMPPVHQYENTRGHPHSNSHASPPIHHSHPPSSHTRNRSHSSSHSYIPPHSYRGGGPTHRHQFPEGLPPAQQAMHSPPLSDRERPRRNDHHEYAPQGDPHAYGHRQPHHQMSPRTQTTEGRSSDRLHSHQRMGSVYNRESPHDRRRELERESDWEIEERRRRDPRTFHFGTEAAPHIHEAIPNSYSPPPSHKSRPPSDRGNFDHHAAFRGREDQGYYQDIHAPSAYPRLSRSGTPASGSASGSGAGITEVPSRPDSRAQYHERASFRLRPVSQPNEDNDFIHDDGRLHNRTSTDRGAAGVGGGSNFATPEQSRTPLDSRKRTRNDIDSDNDVGDGPSGLYSTGRLQEDRGSKRYHREHPRPSVDNHEDNRKGSS